MTERILVESSCALDGSCSRRIQEALCGDLHYSSRNVLLQPGAVYPLKETIRIRCGFYGDSPPPPTILDGMGSTLLLDNTDKLVSVLFADGVQGLMLRNFTVATRRAHYTLGTTLSTNYDTGTAMIQVRDAENLDLAPCHLSSDPSGNKDHWLNRVEAIIGWDAEHRQPAKENYDLFQNAAAEWLECGKNATTAAGESDGLIRLHFKSGRTPPNLPIKPRSVLLRHKVYGFHVFEIKRSQNVNVEDVWIQSGGGMAFVFDQVTNLVLQRVRIAPSDEHVFSVSCDGINIGHPRGGDIRIEDCSVESQGDDGVNLKTSYLELRDWSGSIIYYNMTKGHPDDVPGWRLRDGDPVSIYRRQSFESLNFSTRIVSNIDGILVLEDDIPTAVEKFDLLVNEATFADSMTIVNSSFQGNRGRGALLKSSNVAVLNSAFKYTTGPAIQANPGCIPGGFCEGHTILGNWTVENCTFVGNDYWNWGDGVIYVGAEVPVWKNGAVSNSKVQLTTGIQHQDLTIRNNIFDVPCNKSAFVGHGIDGLILEGKKGCTKFTIGSNCRNVQVLNESEIGPTKRYAEVFTGSTAASSTDPLSKSDSLDALQISWLPCGLFC